MSSPLHQVEALQEPTHEVRFEPLESDACCVCFPCDCAGRVNLDALSEEARRDYLFARATVGRRYTRPAVQLALVP